MNSSAIPSKLYALLRSVSGHLDISGLYIT